MEPPASASTRPSGNHLMPCMEVWGGNRAVDRGVMMAGLDAWLYARPHESEGGGDVHYVSSCATGRITRLLVADVSGHGAEVAKTGERLRQLMRRYVNHIDQTRFVVSLNDEFRRLAAEGRFATSVVATFFAPTNVLALSNAGHPPPLLYRARERRWALLEDPRPEGDLANVPLGVLERTSYGQRGIPLKVGDLLLLYTDSLIEARGRDGRMLGPGGLLEIARGLDARQPDSLLRALLDAIEGLAPANLHEDDVTALLIRPNGLAPRVPVARRLAAPFRTAGAMFRSLLRRGEPVPWPELSIPNIGGAFVDSLNRWGGR